MMSKLIEYRLEDLGRFVGTWHTEGRLLPTQNNPEILIKGTDTYEWLPGGFFLLHKADVLVGNERNQTFEIIGLDKSNRFFTMNYYDSQGNSGFMKATCNNRDWNFLADDLRFTGSFDNNGAILSGIWEASTGADTWNHFMDINLVKAGKPNLA